MTQPSPGHALVTGAVGGIGSATTRRLLKAGYQIIACDRRESLAGDWLAQLSAEEQKRVSFYPLDVSKEDQVNALAETLRTKGVHIACLINNAGINGVGDVWALESRVWERVLRVNLHGTFYLTRAFSKAMVDKRFGRIVNVASLYAYHPDPGESPYAAAKAGVTGFTRAIALELAPHGITVNVIAPGVIWHDGIKGVLSDEAYDKFLQKTPAGRFGKPEEIAGTVAFLCSEEAAYITGQTIHVNGGLYLPG
jgi:NAD(P)-dependent dehydrogenase (short-subunit alcohol dehydrogenase family)